MNQAKGGWGAALVSVALASLSGCEKDEAGAPANELDDTQLTSSAGASGSSGPQGSGAGGGASQCVGTTREQFCAEPAEPPPQNASVEDVVNARLNSLCNAAANDELFPLVCNPAPNPSDPPASLQADGFWRCTFGVLESLQGDPGAAINDICSS